MKRKCLISRSILMILLALLLSASLVACSSTKGKDLQENQKDITQRVTEEGVETSETETKGITIDGLDFSSTSDDVVKKMGTPSEIESAPGVSVYYYGGDGHGENTIYFIDDQICTFSIVDNDLTAPKGVKVGDSVVKALRAYYIPQELLDRGISKDDTDGEMLQKINSRKNGLIFFNNYENSKIKLFFDPPSGIINGISISKGKEKTEPIHLKASDFNASARKIAEKFGYPDEIRIYDEYAFEFGYSDPYAKIMFLKDSSTSANSISLAKNWITPNNIKTGDKIHDVFKMLYIPYDIKNQGISSSMNNTEISRILNEKYITEMNFDALSDYNIGVNVDRSGIVWYISISKYDHPQYPGIRADSAFQIPVFDKETKATKADLYMSGCKFGSTRQEVFQLLGTPRKTEAGYGEIRDKYQDCYFENSAVYFLDIDEYEDLASGRAWYYYIKDPFVIGPRGICVGDPIEKVLAVFPGRDDIDFKTITTETAIYADPESPEEVTNTATVYPSISKANDGKVSINVDWVYWITFDYEDGIITGMYLSELLD